MAHRTPCSRPAAANRRAGLPGSRAVRLQAASGSLVVVGLYGVVLASAMTWAPALWVLAVAPFALAAWVAIRGARRRSGDDGGPERQEASGRGDGLPRALEAERAASQDLLEIDRFVRRLYAALATSGVAGRAVRSLLLEGARFDLAGGEWWQEGSRRRDVEPGGGGAGAEPRPAFRERSRTVHLVAEVAIVISTCEGGPGPDLATGVHALQLQRSPSGWLLRELISRASVLPVSERMADPRPLAPRT